MAVHPDQFYDEVYEKFVADIPDAADQDNILTMLSEVVSGYDGHHDCITILDRYASNACNHTGHGIIMWQGVEYTFNLESGNNRGTVLLEWEGVGREFEEPIPVQYALQPIGTLIDQAIMSGKGPFLVFKWDAVVKNLKLNETLRSYLYDRHFAPGTKTTSHYRAIFAKHQFEVVDHQEADETRARLMKATENDNPANYGF